MGKAYDFIQEQMRADRANAQAAEAAEEPH